MEPKDQVQDLQTQTKAAQAAERARSRLAQMKSDAGAKIAGAMDKADRRANELDALIAADAAHWADGDATSSDLEEWAIENARLLILDPVDARADANKRAGEADS